MNVDTLRQDYTTIRQTLLAEKAMREHVFRSDKTKRDRKCREIDDALAALKRLGDALKVELREYHQVELL